MRTYLLARIFLLGILLLSPLVYTPYINVKAEDTGRTAIITIHNPNSYDVTDYSLKLVLNSMSFGDWEHLTDPSTIYFLDSDNNPLYYWIESFNNANQYSVIWVKVNLTANSDTKIYMHYNAANPYTDYNDPSKVFIIYDDFNNQSTAGLPSGDYGYAYIDNINKYALWLDNVNAVGKLIYLFQTTDLPIVVEYDYWVQTINIRNGYLNVGQGDESSTTAIVTFRFTNGDIQSYDGTTYHSLDPPASYGSSRKHFKVVVYSDQRPKVMDNEGDHLAYIRSQLISINKVFFSTYSTGAYTGKRYIDNVKVYKYALGITYGIRTSYVLTIKVYRTLYTIYDEYPKIIIKLNDTEYTFSTLTKTIELVPGETYWLSIAKQYHTDDYYKYPVSVSRIVFSPNTTVSEYTPGPGYDYGYILVANSDVELNIYVNIYPPEIYSTTPAWFDTRNSRIFLVPGFKYTINSNTSVIVENQSIEQVIFESIDYTTVFTRYFLSYGSPAVTVGYSNSTVGVGALMVREEYYIDTDQMAKGSKIAFGYTRVDKYYNPPGFRYNYTSSFGMFNTIYGTYYFNMNITQQSDGHYYFWINLEGYGSYQYSKFSSSKFSLFMYTYYNDTINKDTFIRLVGDVEQGWYLHQCLDQSLRFLIKIYEHQYTAWNHYLVVYGPAVSYDEGLANSRKITLVFNINAYKVELFPITGSERLTFYNVSKGDVVTLTEDKMGIYKLIIYGSSENNDNDNNYDYPVLDQNIPEEYNSIIIPLLWLGIFILVNAPFMVFGKDKALPVVVFNFYLLSGLIGLFWLGAISMALLATLVVYNLVFRRQGQIEYEGESSG